MGVGSVLDFVAVVDAVVLLMMVAFLVWVALTF